MVCTSALSYWLDQLNNQILQDTRVETKQCLYGFFLSKRKPMTKNLNEGGVTALIETASHATRTIVYETISGLVRVLLFLVFSTALIAYSSISFGAIFLVASCGFTLLSYWLTQTSSEAVTEAVQSTSDLSSEASDTLQNLEAIRFSNAKSQELQRLRLWSAREWKAYFSAQKRIDRNQFIQRLYLVGLFTFFVSSTMLFFGNDPASAIMFYIIGIIAYSQLDLTGKSLSVVFEMTDKLQAVLDKIEYEDKQVSSNRNCVFENRDVQFRNVSFSYEDCTIVKNYNIIFEHKSHVVLVGDSGAGKSTILNLVSGLLKPEKGSVEFGGVPTDELSTKDLSKMVSYISQHSMLFNRSLLENVVYGCKNTSRQLVELVLHDLGLEGLKMRWRNECWLDQKIDKNGLALSGGERQRILIARAIFQARPLLIMDESTSALDYQAEEKVFKAIHQYLPETTIIASTHHRHDALQGYRTSQVCKLVGSPSL